MAAKTTRFAVFAVIVFGMLTLGTPVDAAPQGDTGARCMRLIRDTVGFSAEMNPGNTAFHGGTDGDDKVEVVEEGVVYCGFDGDDVIRENFGTVFGGRGDDGTADNGYFLNHGVFFGESGDDRVSDNYGTFHGSDGDDQVLYNLGIFNGNAGNDFVSTNLGLGQFNGDEGDDEVALNYGEFYGGAGTDVAIENYGICDAEACG